jgi:hypothetical protein
MCHAKDFLIGSEMSEIWTFYLLFKANDFAGIDRDPGQIPVPAKIGLFFGIPVPVKIAKFTGNTTGIFN